MYRTSYNKNLIIILNKIKFKLKKINFKIQISLFYFYY